MGLAGDGKRWKGMSEGWVGHEGRGRRGYDGWKGRGRNAGWEGQVGRRVGGEGGGEGKEGEGGGEGVGIEKEEGGRREGREDRGKEEEGRKEERERGEERREVTEKGRRKEVKEEGEREREREGSEERREGMRRKGCLTLIVEALRMYPCQKGLWFGFPTFLLHTLCWVPDEMPVGTVDALSP